jgi:FMN phosphatase YigB (HAD superfamily)
MEPVNVFAALGRTPEVQRLLAPTQVEDFTRLRVMAESSVRRTSEHEEVSLLDIWAWILDALNAQDDPEEFADMEIATELEHIEPAPWIDGFADALRRHSLACVIVSDSYLPRSFFDEAMKGIPLTPMEIFVSSDHRLTKHSGALWGRVLQHLRVAPDEILHVGDNPHADVAVPQRYGLRATHLVTWTMNQDPPELSRDGVLPASRHLQDWRRRDWSPEEPLTHFALGFSVGATVLLGYAKWLIDLADGRDLLFLPREGLLLREVVRSLDCDRKTSILPISRIVIQRQALLTGPSEALVDALVPQGTVVDAERLIALLFASLPAVERASIFERFLSNVSPSRFVRRSEFVAFLLEFAVVPLLDVAEAEQRSVLRILSGINLAQGYAVADSGWRGTTQGYLEKLAAAQLVASPGLGLYLGTNDSTYESPAGVGPMFGYLSTTCDRPVEKSVVRGAVDIIEEWLGSDTQGPVLGYASDGSPILGSPERTAWRPQFQAGLREGTKRLLTEGRFPSRVEARTTIQRFFGYPPDAFIRLCADIRHSRDAGHTSSYGVVDTPSPSRPFYVHELLYEGFFLGRIRAMVHEGRMENKGLKDDIHDVVTREFSSAHADFILR